MSSTSPALSDALENLSADLERRLGEGRVRRAIALAPYTTFKIGGPADLFVEAESADELADVLTTARAAGVSYFLLGLGANILIGDRGFRGLVVRNHAAHATVDTQTGRVRRWITAPLRP